jgi:hypothetical protein
MKLSSVYLQANIAQLGATARACLAPGQHGKVLAVFSKVIYLLTETDELFWITTKDVPMHRRCMQISSPLPGLTAGTPFRMLGHFLTIDPGFTCDINNAPLWSAPRGDRILEIPSLAARIQAFFLNLDYSQTKGFGNFIPHILSLSQNDSTDLLPESADLILLFAQPLVLDMACACLEHQSSRIASNADALIGLGAGLTPSGDDFLGGILFAMKILQVSYPDSLFTNFAIPTEPYRPRTHLISFTLLKDLANGHAIAPLHFIINGLLSGESLESIYPFVLELTRLGHSTGWDMLTGLLVGLLTAYRSNYFIPSFQMTQTMQA